LLGESDGRNIYGRQQELELALPALYEGRNVLVRGLWRVGKTAFILRLLHICEKVMRRGALNGVEQIDEQTFPTLANGAGRVRAGTHAGH